MGLGDEVIREEGKMNEVTGRKCEVILDTKMVDLLSSVVTQLRNVQGIQLIFINHLLTTAAILHRILKYYRCCRTSTVYVCIIKSSLNYMELKAIRSCFHNKVSNDMSNDI